MLIVDINKNHIHSVKVSGNKYMTNKCYETIFHRIEYPGASDDDFIFFK